MSCATVHETTDTDRAEFMPSPEHIAAECRAIQATWKDGEYANRRGGLRERSNPSREAMKERKVASQPDKCNPVPYCCECFVRLTVSPGYETSLHNHDGKLWCTGCLPAPTAAVIASGPKGYSPRKSDGFCVKYAKKQLLMQRDRNCSNCRMPLNMNQASVNRAIVIGNRLSCPRCMDTVRLAAALAGESVRNGKQILAAHAMKVAAGITPLTSDQDAVKGGAL